MSALAAGDTTQTLRPIDDGDVSVRGHPARHIEETADPSGQHQFRQFRTAAVGSGNRAADRRKKPADAQVVRAMQERRQFAGDSRHRAEAAGKNAQVSCRRKVAGRRPKGASRQFRRAYEVSWMYEGCVGVQARDAAGAIASPTEKARRARPTLQAKTTSQSEGAGGVSCGYSATDPLQSGRGWAPRMTSRLVEHPPLTFVKN
jgi:hypothetical protein